MRRGKTRILRNTINAVLVALIVLLCLVALINFTFNFLYLETTVKGFSMLPTINSNVEASDDSGDKILINKYQIGEVNDIVVAKVDWFEHLIIKRMVGMPGDKIEIKETENSYELFVNDKLLYEKDKYGTNSEFGKTGSYAYFETYQQFLSNSRNTETDGTNKYIRLGEDEYFLMGDNWGKTLDCMTKGPIKKSEIVGKVELIVDVTNENPFVYMQHFIKKIFSKN